MVAIRVQEDFTIQYHRSTDDSRRSRPPFRDLDARRPRSVPRTARSWRKRVRFESSRPRTIASAASWRPSARAQKPKPKKRK